MDMMGSCNHMMQGGMMGSTMPQLPPGNAKLQLQMQAEMMQKMGETLAKYAAQIKEEKNSRFPLSGPAMLEQRGLTSMGAVR